MKLHFLLAGLVAVGLVASQPDVQAHGGGGGGGGGGGRGGGGWHGGGGGGNWHGGGWHGGRFGRGRFFYHGRYYYGYGPGFAFFGYPWWGWYGYPGWGWDYYGDYPYYGYGYNGASYDQSDSRSDPPQFNSTRAVQAALAWRGFYSGRIDGAMGPETSSAIRAFQKQQGLPVTGQIDSELSKALQRRN